MSLVLIFEFLDLKNGIIQRLLMEDLTLASCGQVCNLSLTGSRLCPWALVAFHGSVALWSLVIQQNLPNFQLLGLLI